MQVYFDESGNFRPSLSQEIGLCAVMGVIIPENEAASLREDFLAMIGELPRDVFVNGEPKGYRLSAQQSQLLATLINAHSGVKLAPVTVNTASIEQSFFEKFPPKLKELLTGESEKCLYETMQTEVSELARRCGNLSSDQLVRLLAYTVGVRRAIDAVSTFYHCSKYHACYDPMQMIFDRAGTPNSREELVFKQMVFMWLVRMTEREPITKIREIHTQNHPLMRLYETTLEDGQKRFDLVKLLRGNLHFADSKQTWQLQLADMLASAWLNSLRDHSNTRGYAPIFRSLNLNSSLPNDQPTGMIGVAESYSQTAAPVHFDLFRRLVAGDAKLLPCGWEER
jgi:hypothetical protein